MRVHKICAQHFVCGRCVALTIPFVLILIRICVFVFVFMLSLVFLHFKWKICCILPLLSLSRFGLLFISLVFLLCWILFCFVHFLSNYFKNKLFKLFSNGKRQTFFCITVQYIRFSLAGMNRTANFFLLFSQNRNHMHWKRIPYFSIFIYLFACYVCDCTSVCSSVFVFVFTTLNCVFTIVAFT